MCILHSPLQRSYLKNVGVILTQRKSKRINRFYELTLVYIVIKYELHDML